MKLDHFSELWSNTDEVITHSYVQDVLLPSGKVLALITLDNNKDHTRPSTLGPLTLKEFAETLEFQEQRAKNGEIHGLAVTGKPYFLAAGADLSKVGSIPSTRAGRLVVELGHFALGKLGSFPVPTFVFINGLALGGGLEIALNANYRMSCLTHKDSLKTQLFGPTRCFQERKFLAQTNQVILSA